MTQTFEGASLTLSGWGYVSSSSKAMSNDLRFALITGWSNAACKVPYKTLTITDNMLCASSPKMDTDACQGDSGGKTKIISSHWCYDTDLRDYSPT